MDELTSHYESYVKTLHKTLSSVPKDDLAKLVEALTEAAAQQRTVFIIGNGGNASTASHWATDLGKGLRHSSNMHIKALSLSDNVSWISAVANDIDYSEIFSDQLKSQGRKDDLLICLSASGESKNILRAIEQAKAMCITSFSIIGFSGGVVKEASDHAIHIATPDGEYGIVEDAQLILNHFICDYLKLRSSEKSPI